MSGAWEGNRTPDLLITNELLCRLSYPGASTHSTGKSGLRKSGMDHVRVTGPKDEDLVTTN